MESAQTVAAEAASIPSSEAPTPSTASKLCGICNSNPSKYKCPRCYMPYCSVACNKVHRENHPADPEPATSSTEGPKTEPIPMPEAEILKSDPSNPFHALDSSVDKLQQLFAKYPDLQNQLLEIHAATQRPDEDSERQRIPASLLKSLPQRDNWNHDIGIKNGKEALRKARRANGDRGEGVREYCELIHHLMNGGGSANDVLHQRAFEQDTQLIERLMAEEKR